MSFLHLFIVNKSGGLIHHRSLLSTTASGKQATGSSTNQQIGTNEWLRIASTFHSLHAIAVEASPIKLQSSSKGKASDDGIEEIRVCGMILRCLQTITGIKFIITITDPTSVGTVNVTNASSTAQNYDATLSSLLQDVLKEVYVLYSECVLKDPFYELEMPIRSDLFVQAINILIYQKYTPILQKLFAQIQQQSSYPTSHSSQSQQSSSQNKLLY